MKLIESHNEHAKVERYRKRLEAAPTTQAEGNSRPPEYMVL
jgi:hypothetical protein